jgi:hypothetical protein
MPARPEVGQTYRQEYLAGEAEDSAAIIGVGELVSVSGESYSDVVVTRDVTPLEPDLIEYKFYAPGVGLVLELGISPEITRGELIEFSTQ